MDCRIVLKDLWWLVFGRFVTGPHTLTPPGLQTPQHKFALGPPAVVALCAASPAPWLVVGDFLLAVAHLPSAQSFARKFLRRAPPPGCPTSKNERPLRARPAKPCGAGLPLWPRRPYRPRVVAVGHTWLQSAIATERSNEPGVAARRFASARGAVKSKIQAPVPRTDAWCRRVARLALRPQATRAHACSSKGARRANSPLRGQAATWSPKTSMVPEGQREAQAPTQGDVRARRACSPETFWVFVVLACFNPG